MHSVVMSLLSNKDRLDFVTNLKQVGIEMFAIINNKGRIIHSEKFDSLCLKRDKSEMFLMELALQHSMLGDFDDEFGTVNYTITERNGKKFVSAPLREKNVVLLVAKKRASYKSILKHLESLRQMFTFWNGHSFGRD